MKFDEVRTLDDIAVLMWERSQRTQTRRGRDFQLTVADVKAMITPAYEAKLISKLNEGKLEHFLTKDLYGYVVSWIDAKFYWDKSVPCTSATMKILNKKESTKRGHFIEGCTHSDKSIKAIAVARTGTTQTEETKAKIRASRTGTTDSDETRAKKSAAQTGKTFSDEHRLALREAKIGKKRGPYKKKNVEAEQVDKSETVTVFTTGETATSGIPDRREENRAIAFALAPSVKQPKTQAEQSDPAKQIAEKIMRNRK